MNKPDTKLRQLIRSLIIEESAGAESLLLEARNPVTSEAMRLAVQMALASTGRFDYPHGSSSREYSRGIRINPVGDLGTKEKADVVMALRGAARDVGLVLGDEISPKSTPGGREKEISGTFFSWQIINIENWLKQRRHRGRGNPRGLSFLQQALAQQGQNFSIREISDLVKRKALTDEYVVVNSRSLQNKLFTGQGLGELAEYATAAAINDEKTPVNPDNPTGEFKKAVEGSILDDSWVKAAGNQALMNDFAEAYTNMRNKASANIQQIPDFNFGEAKVEGGTGTYDVVTSTALVHVKYDDPSRLSGIQQKTEDLSKAKKSTPDEDIVFGMSDRYWKKQRAAFKAAIGKVGEKKDKELLGEWGFYEVLLNGGPYTKIDQSTDPEVMAWRDSITPGDIADKLIHDISTEYGASQRADAAGNPMPQFYFSYFPMGDNDYRLKIESVEFGDEAGPVDIAGSITLRGPAGQVTKVRNLEIQMNPSYSGREGGTQIGRPYVAKSGNHIIFELELRAESASKPIQIHRGDDFSAAIDASSGTTMAKVLVNEIRKLIRRVIQEENERVDSALLSQSTQISPVRRLIRETLLLEELTKSDKKEIERLAKKQAKIYFDRELSSAIEKEIKKRNGVFDKQTNDIVTTRFKNLKSDKDFDDAVIRVSKRVLKALHDMHYKRTNLIDKMPVPKT